MRERLTPPTVAARLQKPEQPCACGCGELAGRYARTRSDGRCARGDFKKGAPKTYKQGHAPNGRAAFEELGPAPLCGCGCGRKVTRRRDGKWNALLQGHNARLYDLATSYIERDAGYETLCWEWSRATDDNGYGVFTLDRKSRRAHVWFYERQHGPVLPGLHLHHWCENKPCVRPEHLAPLTSVAHRDLHWRVAVNDLLSMSTERGEELREALRDRSVEAVARAYGVSRSTLSLLARTERR